MPADPNPRRRLGTSRLAARRAARRPQARRRLARGRRLNLAGRARGSLRRFRQATILAVAITSLLLLLLAPETSAEELSNGNETTAPAAAEAGEAPPQTAAEAAEEAVGAALAMWNGFVNSLPRVGVALIALFLAWAIARLVRGLVRRLTRSWQRGEAISALSGIAVWLVASGLAASALAGDMRALVGSLGLIGLALSWALQTPIESFTGWLLNSFQGYYRVGDRVSVGEVFGDVVKIDFLTTTVWEIGGPQRQGFVQAEQPTGRMVTFPNNEVLAGSVVNLTRDFPYVWDELSVQVANESDLRHAMEALRQVAASLLGDQMVEPARAYARRLERSGLVEPIAEVPQVFASMEESWTNLTIRYLVGARERRRWKSELVVRVTEELNRTEHEGKILAVYPRRQLQAIDPDGRARKWVQPSE
jgi:small-conductance mechanosensitive channel